MPIQNETWAIVQEAHIIVPVAPLLNSAWNKYWLTISPFFHGISSHEMNLYNLRIVLYIFKHMQTLLQRQQQHQDHHGQQQQAKYLRGYNGPLPISRTSQSPNLHLTIFSQLLFRHAAAPTAAIVHGLHICLHKERWSTVQHTV